MVSAPEKQTPTVRLRLAAPSVLSVDVEDYFHVEAFRHSVNRDEWGGYPSRVRENTRRLMDLFDSQNAKGTFFVLGWIANKYPQLVREIVRRGHEAACHSYWHRLVYDLSPAEFRRDTLMAKDAVEQAGGREVLGYRAPCFSITRRCPWAMDILAEAGFRYDSSVFPAKHEWYGIADAPRTPFRIPTQSGPITEFPMTTVRVPGSPNLPVGGGGYLRLLPAWYNKLGVRRAWREGLTVVAYIHPWEVDPEQPRIAASLKSRLRHYTNLRKTAGRLGDLLSMGEFCAFRSIHRPQLPLWDFSAGTQSFPAAVPELAS